jgi:hypothetical protein
MDLNLLYVEAIIFHKEEKEESNETSLSSQNCLLRRVGRPAGIQNSDGPSGPTSVSAITRGCYDSSAALQSLVCLREWILKKCTMVYPKVSGLNRNKIYAYSNKHSLRSNTKGYGDRND